MPKQTAHTRLLAFPFPESPAGGQLDALREETQGKRTDLLMDYHELQLSAPPALVERDGKPCEQVQGVYIPRRIRFIGAQIVERERFQAPLDYAPLDRVTRSLTGALQWRTPEGQDYYMFGLHPDEPSYFLVIAQRCGSETRTGPTKTTAFTRDWSPPPASPARLVPNPKRIRERYNGDPISIRLDDGPHRRRLFIGGVDIQGEQRPDVHVVLNLGEAASRWTATTSPLPADRWANKGEGQHGMNAGEIAEEARWVIEHLQANRRVLVHCMAGMNRSATICCAVLILLERLSAEAALERVREHHPWARPDSHHWLALRWLAHQRTTP